MEPIKKVMLVDDHPAFILALRAILSKNPMLEVVATCSDGTSAWHEYKRCAPDLVIIDLDIPNLNGLDLLARIRKTDTYTRVLVVSGQPAGVASMSVQQTGGNGYVPKTEGTSRLLSAIQATLSGFNCFPDAHAHGSVVGPPAMARLSTREVSVLRYLARGHSNQEIAAILNISHKTVSTHKSKIIVKLGISNLVDLAAFASANHII